VATTVTVATTMTMAISMTRSAVTATMTPIWMCLSHSTANDSDQKQ
jgi:hypothetical protein